MNGDRAAREDGEPTAGRDKFNRVMAVVVALAAFFAAMVTTSGAGPGLDPDSMAYVGAATSLASRGELRVPASRWESSDSTTLLTTWPPAFPILIAGAEKLGAPPLLAARVVMGTAAAVTSAIVFLLLAGALPLWGAILATTAALVTPAFVNDHLSVLSEPLFLACLSLLLYAMVRGRAGWAGIAAAAAVMTRYAGASAPAGAAVWFLFFQRRDPRRRIRDAALAVLPSALMLAVWVMRAARASDAQNTLQIRVYPGIGAGVAQGLATLSEWAAPGFDSPLRTFIAIPLLAGAGIALAGAIARGRASPVDGAADRQAILCASLISCAAYLAVLLLSRLFAGGTIPFDWRILSPAILLLEVAIAAALAIRLPTAGGAVRAAVAVGLTGWLIGATTQSANDAQYAVSEGNDFASPEWRGSPTIAWIRSAGTPNTIYTNWPAAVYFRAGRLSRDMPNKLNPDTLAAFSRALGATHGAFVAFEARSQDYPLPDSVARAIGLAEVARLSDGKIWMVRKE